MKKKRERERERLFVFVVVIHPLMCCSRCLKAQVRCVCFSAFEALFSILIKNCWSPKFLFDATCNDSERHRTTRKRHKRRAGKKQLIKKKNFLGKRNQKNPKKGGALHQLIFERLFSRHFLSRKYSLLHTYIYTTHIFSFDDVNDEKKKKKKKANFYRVSENI